MSEYLWHRILDVVHRQEVVAAGFHRGSAYVITYEEGAGALDTFVVVVFNGLRLYSLSEVR